MTLFRQALHVLGRRPFYWISVGIVASILISTAELGVALLLQSFFIELGLLPASAATEGQFAALRFSPSILAIILIGLAVLRSVGAFLVHMARVNTHQLTVARLRLSSLRRLLFADGGRYPRATEIQLQFGELFPKAGQFVGHMISTLSSAVQVLLLFVVMFYVEWRGAMVGTLGVCMMGWVISQWNRKLRQVAADVPVEQNHIQATLERVTHNWLLVKSLRTEKLEFDGLLNNVLRYAASNIRANAYGGVSGVLPPVGGVTLLVGIAAAGLTVWGTTGADLLTFLYLFLRFTQTLGSFASDLGWTQTHWPQFRQAFMGTRREARTLFAEADSHLRRVSPLGTFHSGAPFQAAERQRLAELSPPALALDGVQYTYDGADRPSISSITFRVAAGTQFGIIGRSGSGKSTLLGLILGVYKAESGSVLVSGKDAAEYFAGNEVRVGYVGADPFIFAGSIRDNLTYGLPWTASDTDCCRALTDARLIEFANPGRLSHVVREGGEGLSAGQKQRLALARAFLCQPNLLVLDEASANIDDQTEQEIAEVVQKLKGKTTIIIVSHRPGILRYADRVLQLKDGQAQEVRTHRDAAAS